MNREELLAELNRFYNLELFQVDLYSKQSKTVDDIMLANTLERFAEVEEQHVDNIGNTIKDLGGKPAVITEFLAPIGGKVFGEMSRLPGLATMLKINIWLEDDAMTNYMQLILKVSNDQGLAKMLWHNLVDEDSHKTWFSKQLQGITPKSH